jgi:hypothetical protein
MLVSRGRANLRLERPVSVHTNVYVDGFNLYYGCVKGTSEKWLDLSQMCQKVLPSNSINRIRYFTARVRPPANDPQKLQRQLIYLRALRTIPNLSIHEGAFRANYVKRKLAHPPPDGPTTVTVIDPKEKGSDVNLASYLLLDGFKGDYAVAAVVSNDSDLCLPIRMVREELGKDVIVVAPTTLPGRHRSRELQQVATFLLSLRRGTLRACQFPAVLEDADGRFTKPTNW